MGVILRTRHFGAALLALLTFAFLGCGDSNQEFVFTPQGGGQAATGLPPGNVINQGTGPVVNQGDAVNRFLLQFLQSNPPLVLPQAIIGQSTQPLVNAYLVPGGPFPAGTTISDADDETAYTADQNYYVFWVDPNPLANLGHECSLVYLRESDGLIVEQIVDFDPKIGTIRPLEFPTDKEAALIYSHQDWQDLNAIPNPSVPTRAILAQSNGVGETGGPKIGGIGVAGASETRRTADLDAGQDLFVEMGGTVGGFKRLQDKKGDRINKQELGEAISQANLGLNAGDKFVFVLSSHGSTSGRFCVGSETMSWEELCEMLELRVTAGNVNLILDTCYSGTAIAAFDKWKTQTTKRVRVITSTNNTPSYSRGNGLGFNLECAFDAVREQITAAKSDGTLTLEELEKAFEDASFTTTEVNDKLCTAIGDVPGRELSAKLRAWKDDFLDIGTVDKIEATTAGLKLGFTGSPDLINVGPGLAATHIVGTSPCPQNVGSIAIGNNTTEEIEIQITTSSALFGETPTTFTLPGNLGATTRDIFFDCSTQTSFSGTVTIKATRLSDGVMETETVTVDMTITN